MRAPAAPSNSSLHTWTHTPSGVGVTVADVLPVQASDASARAASSVLRIVFDHEKKAGIVFPTPYFRSPLSQARKIPAGGGLVPSCSPSHTGAEAPLVKRSSAWALSNI